MPETQLAPLASPSPEHDGAPLAAEQVSLEEKFHEGDFGDRLGEAPIWFWGSIALSVGFGAALWLQYLRLPSMDVPLLFWAVLMGLMFAWRCLAKRYRSGSTPGKSASFRESRLAAIGRKDDLAWVENLRDVAFEPVLVQKGYSGMQLVKEGVFVVLMVVWLGFYLTHEPVDFFFVIMCCFVSGFIGLMAGGWLLPTYYRISPGQLEVVRRSMINHRMWVQDRYDLRRASLVVRFNADEVTVLSPEEAECAIRLSSLSEPRQFVRSVFLAAVSTHPAPVLPDDALLG